MKKHYSLFLLAALPIFSSGQISLNASMAPAVNSMIIYYDANVPSPAFTFSKSGINNTWDFSSIFADPANDDTVFYLNPASVPGGNAYPTATHATYEGGDESVNILHIDGSGLQYLGFIGDPFGGGNSRSLIAMPPATAMTFPYTYGSSANPTTYVEVFGTGAEIGQPSIDSIRYKTTLNLNSFVIAAGNMILPSGTMPALLERRINTVVDSAWMKGSLTGNMWIAAPGFPVTNIDSAFYWYSNQSLEHYAHALYDDTGLHDVHFYKSTLTTGLSNVSAGNHNTVVYPNPTTEFLGIRGLQVPASTDWTVINANGQEVLKGTSGLENLNIHSLNAGTYILQYKNADGSLRQVRFIKN